MKQIQTNEIPQLFASGKITEDEAVKAIWANVYCSPEKFALSSFDEDSLSEFLLRYHERFKRLLYTFDEKQADFTTFVRNCISFYKLSWRKKSLKNRAEEEFLQTAAKQGEVESVFFADYRSDPQSAEIDLKVKKRRIFGRKRQFKTSVPSLRLAKDTALVLALKSCYSLDDKTIKNLATFTGKTEKEIDSMVEILKSTTEKKTELHSKLVNKRDNAFFRKRKYAVELSNLQADCAEYERLVKSMQNQTKNWQNQNDLLSYRYLCSPKNEEIAKVTGLNARKVSYCISHVQDEGIAEKFHKIFQNECEEIDE